MKTFAITSILILAVVVAAILFLKYRLNNTIDKKNLEDSLDSEIEKVIRSKINHSIVIGVYKDGKSFVKGYGNTSIEGSPLPVVSAVFQIGSVSKLFTASLLQILCDEGVLSMDATLGQLIGATVELSSTAQQVTLRQLVTHTSGFPRIPESLLKKATQLVGKENLMENPYSIVASEAIFSYLKTTEDKREAGKFEYSNYGMGLLGHVLEMVTQKNYETLVVEKLLVPLEMKNTAITPSPVMKDHFIQGYTGSGKPNPPWTFSVLAGAGAFNSDITDMLKFIRANIEDDTTLSRTLKKTHRRQFNGSSGIGWMMPTFLDRFIGNSALIWHNGMVGGYASYVSIDTMANTGLVILSNKAVDVTMLGMMLTRQVRTQSWSS